MEQRSAAKRTNSSSRACAHESDSAAAIELGWCSVGDRRVGPQEVLDLVLLECEIMDVRFITDYPWGSCLPRSLTLSFDLRIHHYTPKYLRG